MRRSNPIHLQGKAGFAEEVDASSYLERATRKVQLRFL